MHRAIRVESEDTQGLERLCRYLVHPPIAVERLRYDGTEATYRGRRVQPVSGEEAVTLDPLEMPARRMPGAGSSRTEHEDAPEGPTPSHRRREWARLIAKVFEVDPLRCVVAFILDPGVVRKILQHRPRTEPRAHALPPREGLPYFRCTTTLPPDSATPEA